MTLEPLNYEAITEKVAREGELPPEGKYIAKTINSMTVKLSSKGTKGVQIGFNIQSVAKTGADATGYATQNHTMWNLGKILTGTGKTGKPYRLDAREDLAKFLAQVGFAASDIGLVVEAAVNAEPADKDSPVAIFGNGAKALLNANGDVVSLAGREFVVTVKHEEYEGRTNARFYFNKAKAA